MEFYLVKNEKISFRNFDNESNSNTKIRRCMMPGIKVTLDSVPDCAGDLNNGSRYGVDFFRKGLKALLCRSPVTFRPGPSWLRGPSKILHLQVILTMTCSNTASIKIILNWDTSKEGPGAEIFDGMIHSGLPPTSYGFNLKLSVLEWETGERFKFEVNGEDLKIITFSHGFYGLEMTDIAITQDMFSHWGWGWKEGNGNVGDDDDTDDGDGNDDDDDDDLDEDYEEFEIEFEGKMTLSLHLDHCAISKLYLEEFRNKYYVNCSSDLKIGGIDSDMVILAGGEKDMKKGIKCHKKILSGQSPVFEAMFQADMSESKDSCVEIVDMTDAGVRAMLQFIYDRDMEEASKSGEVTLELLEAGHKYQMNYLEDAMMQIILVKPVDWLSVDLILKLLLFSRNIGGKFGNIEKTSLALLKWYAQKKPGSLMASGEFQRLYLEYPRIALELAETFLKI